MLKINLLKLNSLNKLSRKLILLNSSSIKCRFYSEDKSNEIKPAISKDIEEDLKKLKQVRQQLQQNDSEIFNEYKQQEKGFIYDKRPIKVKCKKGKIYMWCACGHSRHQVKS